MNEIAIGIVIGIALAAAVVWLSLRVVPARVDRAMARGARVMLDKGE